MNNKEIWDKINIAYKADKLFHPTWPDHVCGQAAMVGKEAGYLLNVATEQKYNRNGLDANTFDPLLESSAINTIVQAVRFLENLK